MNIRKLEVSDTGNENLCAGFVMTDIECFDQLLATRDQYAREYPNESILCSLDDLGQSQYTAMHATGAHNLDDTQGHDLSGVDRCAFEDGEHLGYLSTQSEFFIRRNNFDEQAKNVTFDDACSRGLGLNDGELAILEKLNASPELALDKKVVLWIVPVHEQAMALCASPNGYFSADLNPFENLALASRLDQMYSYQLFGIGASCIGFRRKHRLDSEQARALAHDLTRLYNCCEDREKFDRLLCIVEQYDHLLLKYGDAIEV